MNVDEIFKVLESDFHFTVPVRSEDFLFVHAGVVIWRDRAIVIPGLLSTGKTCLVRALVQSGATYYSDRFAVFDGNGCVYPYQTRLPPLTPPTDTTNGNCSEVQNQSARVGLILMCQYQTGARWHPRRLSSAQAILPLLNSTVTARIQPQQAISILKKVTVSAPSFQTMRGEAEDIAQKLINLMETTAA